MLRLPRCIFILIVAAACDAYPTRVVGWGIRLESSHSHAQAVYYALFADDYCISARTGDGPSRNYEIRDLRSFEVIATIDARTRMPLDQIRPGSTLALTMSDDVISWSPKEQRVAVYGRPSRQFIEAVSPSSKWLAYPTLGGMELSEVGGNQEVVEIPLGSNRRNVYCAALFGTDDRRVIFSLTKTIEVMMDLSVKEVPEIFVYDLVARKKLGELPLDKSKHGWRHRLLGMNKKTGDCVLLIDKFVGDRTDCYLESWNIVELRLRWRAALPDGSWLPNAAFSPDGLIAVNGVGVQARGQEKYRYGAVLVYDGVKGEYLDEVALGHHGVNQYGATPGHYVTALACGFRKDGRIIAVCDDRTLKVFRLDP